MKCQSAGRFLAQQETNCAFRCCKLFIASLELAMLAVTLSCATALRSEKPDVRSEGTIHQGSCRFAMVATPISATSWRTRGSPTHVPCFQSETLVSGTGRAISQVVLTLPAATHLASPFSSDAQGARSFGCCRPCRSAPLPLGREGRVRFSAAADHCSLFLVSKSRIPHSLPAQLLAWHHPQHQPPPGRAAGKIALTFCPTCANLLLVEECLGGTGLRLYCQTCPYIYDINKKACVRVFAALSRNKVDTDKLLRACEHRFPR